MTPITAFKDFELHITAVVAVKASDYFAEDYDGDEQTFRDAITKEALDGLRNANVDLADAYVDHIEEKANA